MRQALVALVALAGCASQSGVAPLGGDLYTISRQAATGFSGLGTLKAAVLREAAGFCAAAGRSLSVVSTQETQPPYVLGNYPRAEVVFRCQ